MILYFLFNYDALLQTFFRLLVFLPSASLGFQKPQPSKEPDVQVVPKTVTHIDCILPQFFKIFLNLISQK